MAKMNLVLLDEDPYFGEMVSAYIRTSEYAELYGIRVFTTAEQGRLFVEQNTEPLILMVHESLMPLTDAVYGLRPGCTVIISDQAVSGGVLEYPVLCKFQPLDRLLSSITAHYNEYCASRPITGRKGTTITAVYSAAGGTGKTVTAVHLARQLAVQGKRVLCVCMELFPSRGWYEADGNGEGEAFSQLLYYAKTNPKWIPSKLEANRKKHPLWKFDFIPPLPNGAELLEIGGEEITRLLTGLTETGEYDRVILDLDSALLPFQKEVFAASGELLWLFTDDSVHLGKTREKTGCLLENGWLEPADLRGRVKYVHNKWVGSPVNDFAAYGIYSDYRLPYIPDWKAVAGTGTMFSTEFAERAVRLLTDEAEVPAGAVR